MITKEELNSVKNVREKFEISMIYMLLAGFNPTQNFTLKTIQRIRNVILHVHEQMRIPDVEPEGEGFYMNVKIGDDCAASWIERLKKEGMSDAGIRHFFEG